MEGQAALILGLGALWELSDVIGWNETNNRFIYNNEEQDKNCQRRDILSSTTIDTILCSYSI